MVIGAKLRRHEGFFFSWKEDSATGTGRGSIWISSAVPLSFSYDTAARTAINPAWLEALAVSANTPQGLIALEEPASGTRMSRRRCDWSRLSHTATAPSHVAAKLSVSKPRAVTT